jgi:ABC-2 type transport system ATP-binding protein
MRELVRRLPGEDGITVFLSSHLLHEVEQIATRIGILRSGALLFQGTPAELHGRLQPALTLEVDAPEKAARVLAADGWASEPAASGRLRVSAQDGAAAARINARLVAAGLAVSHLALERPSLEDIFLSLTQPEEVPHAVPVASALR